MTSTPSPPRLDPLLVGTLCGLFSAVGYTAANVCLRAVTGCDPIWVSALKAVPTVAMTLPWLIWLGTRGEPVWPRPRIALAITLAGLLGQLGGNVSFQWALGEVGVALTVPLSLGGMIVSAALLGRLLLHEPVTFRMLLALLVMLAAMAVLGGGAEAARESVAQAPATPLRAGLALAAGVFSGFAYAVLGVAIRHGTRSGASLPFTLFAVSVGGLISLSLLSLTRISPADMLHTAPRDLAFMLGAGVFNAISFLSLGKALQLTSVVYVNALNATQATLAAIAGVLFFREALSPELALGVGLTILGLLLMRPSRPPADKGLGEPA